MLFQDYLVIFLILGIILFTVTFNILSFNDVANRFQQKRINSYGENLNWHLVHPYLYKDDVEFFVYDVDLPNKKMSSVVRRQKYITRQVLEKMKVYSIDMPLKDFTALFLKINNNAIHFSQDRYDYYHSSEKGLKRPMLSIEQVGLLLKDDADMDKVARMYRRGLSFEEIIEFHSMPEKWVEALYSKVEIQPIVHF